MAQTSTNKQVFGAQQNKNPISNNPLTQGGVFALHGPCTRHKRYFYYDLSRFSPQFHHYLMKPQDGECETVLSGNDHERGFHQQSSGG